jgi:hypothetical protein
MLRELLDLWVNGVAMLLLTEEAVKLLLISFLEKLPAPIALYSDLKLELG